MSDYQHIAVVMGGVSGEREISLASGRSVGAALREAGYEASLMDAGYDLAEQLIRLKPDAIFNALHGVWGESGIVQGLFESLHIPYTHSGVLASALAMNKVKAKALFAAHGLPLAEHRVVARQEAARQHVMTPPYVIKPIAQGSSLGVLIVAEGANHPPAELTSPDWLYGDEVMVEQYIPDQEFSCAVLGERVLGIAEIVPNVGRFYDYEQKYARDGAKHIVPAKVNESLTKSINETSLAAHQILGCRGASRADFRYDRKTNQLALLEINTQPGMTPMSLVPEIACHIGMDMKSLVCWLVDDASCER